MTEELQLQVPLPQVNKEKSAKLSVELSKTLSIADFTAKYFPPENILPEESTRNITFRFCPPEKIEKGSLALVSEKKNKKILIIMTNLPKLFNWNLF